MISSELTYKVFIKSENSPDAIVSLSELDEVYNFWHTRWESKFSETGSPPESWGLDFHNHDIVVCLEKGGRVVGCHLYSFYDLTRDYGAEYFEFLKPGSLHHIIKGFGPWTMTMEYLCAARDIGRLPLSLGATLIALGARLAFERGCGSILGMPIDGTSVSGRVKDLGMEAECIEKGIQKYGYQLQLLVSDPFVAKSNEPDFAKGFLDLLWDQRKVHYIEPLRVVA